MTSMGVTDNLSSGQSAQVRHHEKKQYTPLLVFGIAARIGSGASFVASGLDEELKGFVYQTQRIKITKIIQESYRQHIDSEASLYGPNSPGNSDFSKEGLRVMELQRQGNVLRQRFCQEYLAFKAIQEIAHHLVTENVLEDSSRRVAYIIDSLKHPSEIALLKYVFRDAFCMVGVVADDNVRRKRLRDQKHISEKAFEVISDIDANENLDHGQHATDSILESDYFFENNYDTPEKISHECKRLLNLLFHCSIITPRQDEYGMRLAAISADKSACLSRQVGAAIISSDGTVLSTGCNDVPQFGGGLYASESVKDHRCFARSRMCHNDDEKRIIADEMTRALELDGRIPSEHFDTIKSILLGKTRLKQLIEFSRAVHAEMDAIIAVARSGRQGLVGSTMYVTTYPCHNCAKHIIDAGIRRVVYIEPYTKSLAQKLHSDAINNPLDERIDTKVSFDNYGGISPTRYADWFSMQRDRKEDSKIIPHSLRKQELLPLGRQESIALAIRLQLTLNRFSSKDGSAIINFPQSLMSPAFSVSEDAP